MNDRRTARGQAERALAHCEIRDRVDRLTRLLQEDPEAPANTTFSDSLDD